MDEIVVEVPFTYQVTYVPPRCRTTTSDFVMSSVALGITSAEPDEMPLAIRVLQPDHSSEWVDLRWTGSRLLRRRSKFDRIDSPGDLQACIETMRNTPLAYKQGTRAVVSDEEIRRGRWISDTYEARRADLCAAAAAMVFCDGYFWEPSAEPVWVSMGAVGGGHLCVRFGLDGVANSAIFRADQQEMAEAQTAQVCRLAGKGAPRTGKDSIDILLPNALTFPAAEVSLASAVRDILDIPGHLVKKMPIDALIAYARLRDAMGELTQDDIVAGADIPGDVPGLARSLMRHLGALEKDMPMNSEKILRCELALSRHVADNAVLPRLAA
jgi:hypothetical protein